jgi:hypothetical protein
VIRVRNVLEILLRVPDLVWIVERRGHQPLVLLAQAIAGLLVDLAERHSLGRLCPGIEGDRTRDERELEVAFPKRTRGRHGEISAWLQVPLGHRPRLRTTLLGEAQVGAGRSVDARLCTLK